MKIKFWDIVHNSDEDISAVLNLRTGNVWFETQRYSNPQLKYTVKFKYMIDGKLYVSLTEIMNEYNLNNRQTVLNRLTSKNDKWKNWIKLT